MYQQPNQSGTGKKAKAKPQDTMKDLERIDTGSNGDRKRVDTIIDGSTEPEKVSDTLSSYFRGLREFLYPESIDTLPANHPFSFLTALRELQPVFQERFKQVQQHFTSIIVEINRRAEVQRSEQFTNLVERESGLWREPEAAGVFPGAYKGRGETGV